MNNNSAHLPSTLEDLLLEQKSVKKYITNIPPVIAGFTPNIFVITPTIGEITTDNAVVVFMTQKDVIVNLLIKINGLLYPDNIIIASTKYKICRYVINLKFKNSDYNLKWLIDDTHVGDTSFNNKYPNRIVVVSGNYSISDTTNYLYGFINDSNYNYIEQMKPDLLIHACKYIQNENNESVGTYKFRKLLDMSSGIRNRTSNMMIGNNINDNNIQNYLHIVKPPNNNHWIKVYDTLAVISIDNLRYGSIGDVIDNLSSNISRIVCVLSTCCIPYHHPFGINMIGGIYHHILEDSKRGMWNHVDVLNLYDNLFSWISECASNECAVIYGGSTVSFHGKVIKNDSLDLIIPILSCGPINMNRNMYENIQDKICAYSLVGTYDLNHMYKMHIEESDINPSICTVDNIDGGLVLQQFNIIST